MKQSSFINTLQSIIKPHQTTLSFQTKPEFASMILSSSCLIARKQTLKQLLRFENVNELPHTYIHITATMTCGWVTHWLWYLAVIVIELYKVISSSKQVYK